MITTEKRLTYTYKTNTIKINKNTGLFIKKNDYVLFKLS